MKKTTIIRGILTFVLMYFIYKETGIATTIFSFNVYVYIELNTKQLGKIANILKKSNIKNNT